MCGRARCTLNPQQVAQACGLHPQHAAVVPTHHTNRYRPSHNVAPGAHLPVFRLRRSSPSLSPAAEVGPVVECMKWGLVPSFMKKTEKPDHYRMFNARSESIKEKASFRRLLPNNRCLVAVEGFYEWKKDGSKKQPYYIHFKDQRPLVFAALYDSWENSEGEILHTFTILTTRSSSTLEWLHDRMPVILSEASIDVWLNDSSAKSETFLAPYGDPDLVWYPVTPAIGKPSFDGPECIKELKWAGEKPLSMFFAKKTTDKNQPENENQKSSKQEYVEDKVKKEPSTEDALEKLAAEKTKDQNEPEKCGIKREFEKIENTHSNSIPSPLKKKERSMKNTGEKQWSLLSYFGKR